LLLLLLLLPLLLLLALLLVLLPLVLLPVLLLVLLPLVLLLVLLRLLRLLLCARDWCLQCEGFQVAGCWACDGGLEFASVLARLLQTGRCKFGA